MSVDMRETLRGKLAHENEQITAHTEEARAILAAVEARDDGGDLTEEEDTRHAELLQLIRDARKAAQEIEGRLAELDELDAARTAAEESAKRHGGLEPVQVRVNADEPVYRKDNGRSFFKDMYSAQFLSDYDAQERLRRHQQIELQTRSPERRDATTTSFGGLVVPQYLTALYAEVPRAGRPFLNVIQNLPLPPDGMTLTIPRGNTGTLVSVQATQATALTERDVTTSNVTIPVVTIGGVQDVSRQALDRGTNVDQVVMADLAAAYVAELDNQAINGTGANASHKGVLSTTGVASVTVTSTLASVQVRKLAEAISAVHTTRYLAADLIVAHPRRIAYWMQSSETDFRAVLSNNMAYGEGDLTAADGLMGRIFGIPLIGDPNIPITQSFGTSVQNTSDCVIVTRRSDVLLWENDPMPNRVRFDETLAGNLAVKIVAWDYSAFSAGRWPTSTKVLQGSGLITPVFGA
jgi:HK97 family phage major capsid protein